MTHAHTPAQGRAERRGHRNPRFLVRDVLAHVWEPVDEALGKHDRSTVASGGITLAAGLAIGLTALVHYDAWIAGRRSPARGPRRHRLGEVVRADAGGDHQGERGRLAAGLGCQLGGGSA
ncbi:hypothetical protein [Streptomyces sp. NRRL F-2799]|uniref:hypothetical protein n=1 Tax=Streptomyces sp. NRRL F-2799 TaxID=1463844 RepID=UPI0004C8A73D|nr:hypothetical protein [Streptomyces sp. NRRL F-2799]